jgi:DNA gyrase subunit A
VDSVAIGHLEAVSGVALAVTDQGRALVVDPHDATVEGLEPGERLVAVVDAGVDLVLATARGLVKRLVADTMGSLRRDRRLIRLDDGDEVVGAWPAEGDLILVTDDAQVLRTGTGDIPARGGAAGGVAGIRVGDGRRVIGGGVGSDGDVVAVLDDTGRVKSTALAELPTTGRGGKGVRLAKLRDGALAAALVADPSTLAVAYARRSGPWPGTSTKRATGMVDGDAAVLAIGLTAVAS